MLNAPRHWVTGMLQVWVSVRTVIYVCMQKSQHAPLTTASTQNWLSSKPLL